jgi:hypothetical protein
VAARTSASRVETLLDAFAHQAAGVGRSADAARTSACATFKRGFVLFGGGYFAGAFGWMEKSQI